MTQSLVSVCSLGEPFEVCDASTPLTGALPCFFNAPLALFLRPTRDLSGRTVGLLSESELQERHDDLVQPVLEPAALSVGNSAPTKLSFNPDLKVARPDQLDARRICACRGGGLRGGPCLSLTLTQGQEAPLAEHADDDATVIATSYAVTACLESTEQRLQQAKGARLMRPVDVHLHARGGGPPIPVRLSNVAPMVPQQGQKRMPNPLALRNGDGVDRVRLCGDEWMDRGVRLR